MTTIRNARESGYYPATSPPLPLPDCREGFSILHPGYPSLNIIITLPKFDLVDGSDPPQFGFHHGTALMICFIITGNKAGFLSPDRIILDDPTAVINSPPGSIPAFDSILLGGSYYYYIYSTRPDERYEVLSEKDDWSFPTESNLRAFHWEQWEAVCGESLFKYPSEDHETTDIPNLVQHRDGACRLTGTPATCGCQPAHFIPEAMESWFFKNAMIMHAKEPAHGSNVTTRASNMCLLRKDIRWMFKKSYFTFVPKQGQLVAHFLSPLPLPACRAFHNASLDRPQDFAGAYLLSRLAFCVIPKTAYFNQMNRKPSSKPQKKRNRSQSDSGGHVKKPKPGPNDENGSDAGTKVSATDDVTRDHNDGLVDEDRELAEDMEAAMYHLPHVFGTSLDELPPGGHYGGLGETLVWYPGHRRIERMKEAYMKANPQVRATSSGGGEGRNSDSMSMSDT